MKLRYRKAIVHQKIGDMEEDTEIYVPYELEKEDDDDVNSKLEHVLEDIERQAKIILDSTVASMAEANGTDEKLKAEDMRQSLFLQACPLRLYCIEHLSSQHYFFSKYLTHHLHSNS